MAAVGGLGLSPTNACEIIDALLLSPMLGFARVVENTGIRQWRVWRKKPF